MNCLFRVDSSLEIGTGHVMRCLSLADGLRRKGAKVAFACRPFPGNLCDRIESLGYLVHRLSGKVPQEITKNRTDPDYAKWLGVSMEEDADQTARIVLKEKVDWLIVDHYGIDHWWERSLRPLVRKIMIIDDLANRRHHGDLLLDQNLHKNMSLRYHGLVNADCLTLLGPTYALLRPMFSRMRKSLRKQSPKVQRIFVFFGGVDLTNETGKAIEAIAGLRGQKIHVDCIVGEKNAHQAAIQKLCNDLPEFHYHCEVKNIAELMSKADLALGAGGTATWERCCLGLATLIISVSQNQVAVAKAVDQMGIARYLGGSHEVNVDGIRKELEYVLATPDVLEEMRTKALDLVDGLGVQRVSGFMTTDEL